MKRLVSAHNCIFGSRHFGIWASTLREWPRLQGDHECLFVIDDLVGHFVQPVDRDTYADKAMLVAKQFLQAGVDGGATIVLTSEMPEIYELAFLLSARLTLEGLAEAHRDSTLALPNASQRAQWGMPASAGAGEALYPLCVISGYVLGLGAEIWQGGLEVSSNYRAMERLLNGFNGHAGPTSLKLPRLRVAEFASVPGYDGRHMTYLNRLDINADPAEIRRQVDTIRDAHVAAGWLRATGATDEADDLLREGLTSKGRARTVEAVADALAPFRTVKVTNRQILDALEHGTRRGTELVAAALSDVRSASGVGSYLAARRSS